MSDDTYGKMPLGSRSSSARLTSRAKSSTRSPKMARRTGAEKSRPITRRCCAGADARCGHAVSCRPRSRAREPRAVIAGSCQSTGAGPPFRTHDIDRRRRGLGDRARVRIAVVVRTDVADVRDGAARAEQLVQAIQHRRAVHPMKRRRHRDQVEGFGDERQLLTARLHEPHVRRPGGARRASRSIPASGSSPTAARNKGASGSRIFPVPHPRSSIRPVPLSPSSARRRWTNTGSYGSR